MRVENKMKNKVGLLTLAGIGLKINKNRPGRAKINLQLVVCFWLNYSRAPVGFNGYKKPSN
jgi:hypothetical protein